MFKRIYSYEVWVGFQFWWGFDFDFLLWAFIFWIWMVGFWIPIGWTLDFDGFWLDLDWLVWIELGWHGGHGGGVMLAWWRVVFGRCGSLWWVCVVVVGHCGRTVWSLLVLVSLFLLCSALLTMLVWFKMILIVAEWFFVTGKLNSSDGGGWMRQKPQSEIREKIEILFILF